MRALRILIAICALIAVAAACIVLELAVAILGIAACCVEHGLDVAASTLHRIGIGALEIANPATRRTATAKPVAYAGSDRTDAMGRGGEIAGASSAGDRLPVTHARRQNGEEGVRTEFRPFEMGAIAMSRLVASQEQRDDEVYH